MRKCYPSYVLFKSLPKKLAIPSFQKTGDSVSHSSGDRQGVMIQDVSLHRVGPAVHVQRFGVDSRFQRHPSTSTHALYSLTTKVNNREDRFVRVIVWTTLYLPILPFFRIATSQ